MIRRATWRAARLIIRRSADGWWVLRRGTYYMTSSRDWEDMRALAQRIVDRERRQAARDAYISKVVNYG